MFSLCIPSVACMSTGSGPCSQIQDSWGLTVLLQHELSAGVYSVLIRLQPETPFTTLKTLQFYLLRFPLCPLLLRPTCTLQSPACCFTLSALGWGDLLSVFSLLLEGCYSLYTHLLWKRDQKQEPISSFCASAPSSGLLSLCIMPLRRNFWSSLLPA